MAILLLLKAISSDLTFIYDKKKNRIPIGTVTLKKNFWCDSCFPCGNGMFGTPCAEKLCILNCAVNGIIDIHPTLNIASLTTTDCI